MTLSEFLSGAGQGGPAVAVTTAPRLPDLGPDTRMRTVSGTTATTLGGLYTSFARVWDFPDHFGRNKDAFDDCMRDLATPGDEGGVPPVIVVHISHAHRLLNSDDTGFTWFAQSVEFYRDEYRGEGRTFAVILSTSDSRLGEVRARWSDAGVAVTDLTHLR
ncbi:barstar family protein [Gordonia rubripertincta]|uniref:Barstar family protein n=2 Tax=Gordonia rubripertincta TaxID=36822 RepID=A0AAW4G4V9_GORRU|nr:barstar family protein [Gordonia rubripertincta]MBM7278171.1 barstar family protein [Gordonia rubripertincta]MDG6781015.1 barstar family protein [Gordonia rubripertincta]NKY62505.1 barstar family protein [Gordonia rubripertincta]QMU22317.1 barstar family protein [Gordonia rubripertincta]GAB86245.1 hypothetical protein GORBP_070_00490 [Gordonia rubripertincta NBRC 101908]